MSEFSFSLTLDALCRGKRLGFASLIRDLESSASQDDLRNRLAAASLSTICDELNRPCDDRPLRDDLLFRDFIAARDSLDKIAREAFFRINATERAAATRTDCAWYPNAIEAIRIVEAVRRLAKAYRAIRDSAPQIDSTPFS